MAREADKQRRERKAHRNVERKARNKEKLRNALLKREREGISKTLETAGRYPPTTKSPTSRANPKRPLPVGPGSSVERLDVPPPRLIAQLQALVRNDANGLITDEVEMDKAIASSEILDEVAPPASPPWY